MKIQFTVSNQHIEAKAPSKIVADSKNYLEAAFFFVTSEWEGLQKTVVFSSQYGTFNVMLEGSSCMVPWECIVAGELSVSVFAGDRITTDVAKVKVFPSGYRLGETPREPTPDVYAEILDRLQTIQAGTVSQTDIEKAVESYLVQHPVETLKKEDVTAIVESCLEEYSPELDLEQVASVVSDYFAEHADDFKGETGEEGPQGPQGEPGAAGEDGEAPEILIKGLPSDKTIHSGSVYDLGVAGSDSTFLFSFDGEEDVEEVCAACFVSKDGEVPLFQVKGETDVLVPRILSDVAGEDSYRVEFRKSDKVLRIM